MTDTSAVAIRRFNRNIELNCVTRVLTGRGIFFVSDTLILIDERRYVIREES